MEALILIILTGLGLGGLYFLLASGLALIFGLMNVLSFAHGAVLSLCGYIALTVMRTIGADRSWSSFILALIAAIAAGALFSYLMEVLVLRRLFGKSLEQLLATVGIGIALVALMQGIWGPDEQLMPLPEWFSDVTVIAGITIPNNRFVIVGAAVAVLIGILLFLGRTRQGIIIRAGVENREMVQAMGINVQRSFSLVFLVAGALAGLGGGLALVLYRAINPTLGDGVLIFAFIVLIVGGVGSIAGAAIAAAGLGLIQSLANFYIAPGIGDILVVVALAVTLLVRPSGLLGRKARLA
jgi:branched-chain amino acid transport system permease protein